MSDNILEWGINFLHEIQASEVSFDLVLTWMTDELHTKSVTGSLVDEAGRVIPGQGAKTVTEYTRFMITSEQLINVPLVKGLRITWNSNEYEVVQDGGKCWYFNDVLKRSIILVAKHVSN